MSEHDHHSMVNGEHSPVEYFKFILVIAIITCISLFIYSSMPESDLREFLRLFMGVFFVVFAGFKFAGYRMFSLMFAGYDVVAKRIKIYAYAYPFIELGLGILYVWNFAPTYRELLTLSIMGIGTIGVAQEIKKRSGIHCACLGNIIKLPLSTVSLAEDVGMGLMALLMLVVG